MERRCRPLPEAAEECLERADEGLDVGEDLRTEDLRQRCGGHAETSTHQAQRAARRVQQQPHEPAVEQRAQVFGSVQEVQG